MDISIKTLEISAFNKGLNEEDGHTFLLSNLDLAGSPKSILTWYTCVLIFPQSLISYFPTMSRLPKNLATTLQQNTEERRATAAGGGEGVRAKRRR